MWEGDGVEGEEEEGFRERGVCCFGFGWGVVEEAWGAQGEGGFACGYGGEVGWGF